MGYIQKDGRFTIWEEKPFPELSWRLNTIPLYWGGWNNALKKCDWIHERWREYLELVHSRILQMERKTIILTDTIEDIQTSGIRTPFRLQLK